MTDIKSEQQAVIQDYRVLSEIDKELFKTIIKLMMIMREFKSQNEQNFEN